MNTPIRQPVQRATDASELYQRLRSVGMLLLQTSPDGEITAPSRTDGDWMASLALDSGLIRSGLRQQAQVWVNDEEPRASSLFDGCWCVPVPVLCRRKRMGYGVILIFTEEILASEQLAAMCQGAHLDFEYCRSQFAALPPARESDIGRLAQLARFLFLDYKRLETTSRTMESVGQQLAESYEEISLLYTISQSMTVVQQPRRFVLSAAEGLLNTLAFRWIGAQFIDQFDSLRALSGKLVIAGDPAHPTEALRSLTLRLLELCDSETPIVIDPKAKPEHADFAPLGSPLLIHPISREGRMLGILIAADKLSDDKAASSADMKLLGATASHTGIFLENAALYEDMDAMFLGTLEALTASIDAKDRYTCGHSRRVAHLSQHLAQALDLGDHAVRRIHVAGLVHDVGKIGVPESVLCKPGRLTEAEFDLIKQHPEIGYRILKDIPQLKDVLPGVLHHHERWDGGGYPDGLEGEEIPIFARLIALADSFDAMSSTRTYRSARRRPWVLDEIRASAGTQFDPRLVPTFLDLDFSEFDRLVEEHRANDVRQAQSRGEAA